MDENIKDVSLTTEKINQFKEALELAYKEIINPEGIWVFNNLREPKEIIKKISDLLEYLEKIEHDN